MTITIFGAIARLPHFANRQWFAVLLMLLFASFNGGCLSQQVAKDGNGIREALVDLYTDQAMDNLIRAREHRLFVQLKYSQLSVNDKHTLNASAMSEQATFTTAIQQATRAVTFAAVFPFSATKTSDRTLSFQADPVVDQNYIYNEYLSFAEDPSLFFASKQKPSCPCHIARKCGDTWYFVPANAGSAFLQLVIDTSVGLEPQGAGVWTVSVKSASYFYDSNGDAITGVYQLTLDSAVPNDEGRILVALASASRRSLILEAMPVHEGPYEPNKKG